MAYMLVRAAATNARRFAPTFPPRETAVAGALLRRAHSTVPPSADSPKRAAGHGSDGDVPGINKPTRCSRDTLADRPSYIFPYDEEDLASEESLWALYERWREFYGVERDCDDVVRRFDGFNDQARSVYGFNKLSGRSYARILSPESDWTDEERYGTPQEFTFSPQSQPYHRSRLAAAMWKNTGYFVLRN